MTVMVSVRRVGGAEAPVLRIDRSVTRSVRLYNADRLRWTEEAAAVGPIVRLGFGPIIPTLVLTDAEAARSVLVTDAGSWRRPAATITPIRVAGGDNLFTQPDAAWSQLQPSLSPHFRKRALEPRLAEMAGLVDEEVAALPVGGTIDFDQAMGRLSLKVAAWVLFGHRLERDHADELVIHQRAVIDWVGRRIASYRALLPVRLGPADRQMRRHAAPLWEFASQIVASRQADSGPRHDVLDALLATRPNGRPLTRHQLAAHVFGMVTAGNETAAAALVWAVAHGGTHPQAWAALRSDPEWASCYVAETLRVSPPAWGLTRSPAGPGAGVVVGGRRVRVRRGRLLDVNILGMNRDPSVWPEPKSFDPARHKDPTKHQERSMLPFGLGPRGCIGQQLAISEMTAVLPALARRGDVHIQGTPAEDPTFSLRVRGGLHGAFGADPHVPPAR
jgi:cytochrome P450